MQRYPPHGLFFGDRTERHTVFLVPGAGRLSPPLIRLPGCAVSRLSWDGVVSVVEPSIPEGWGVQGRLRKSSGCDVRRGVVPTAGPCSDVGMGGDRCDGVFACDSRVARSLNWLGDTRKAGWQLAWTAAAAWSERDSPVTSPRQPLPLTTRPTWAARNPSHLRHCPVPHDAAACRHFAGSSSAQPLTCLSHNASRRDGVAPRQPSSLSSEVRRSCSSREPFPPLVKLRRGCCRCCSPGLSFSAGAFDYVQLR